VCRTISPSTGPTSGAEREESVEDAFLDVRIQVHADGQGGEHDGLHDDAGQHELDVLAGSTGDGTAEDEHEDRGHQDRLERDVDELLGAAEHLRDGALGEDERVADHAATSFSVSVSDLALPVSE
jgi:hypothetical protein